MIMKQVSWLLLVFASAAAFGRPVTLSDADLADDEVEYTLLKACHSVCPETATSLLERMRKNPHADKEDLLKAVNLYCWFIEPWTRSPSGQEDEYPEWLSRGQWWFQTHRRFDRVPSFFAAMSNRTDAATLKARAWVSELMRANGWTPTNAAPDGNYVCFPELGTSAVTNAARSYALIWNEGFSSRNSLSLLDLRSGRETTILTSLQDAAVCWNAAGTCAAIAFVQGVGRALPAATAKRIKNRVYRIRTTNSVDMEGELLLLPVGRPGWRGTLLSELSCTNHAGRIVRLAQRSYDEGGYDYNDLKWESADTVSVRATKHSPKEWTGRVRIAFKVDADGVPRFCALPIED